MIFNREIGMKTGTFSVNQLSVILQIIFIYFTCFSTIAAPAVSYPRPNKRQFSTPYMKNRHNSDSYNGKHNDTTEYDRPLIFRDLFLKPFSNGKKAPTNLTGVQPSDVFTRKNRMSKGVAGQRSFEVADGMTRLLTFPMKNNDRGILKGFEAGSPDFDCLTGGLDAGVIDGALKIGIGVDLAPECGPRKDQSPKLVPVPIFIPRPVAVPVGVPQPYPIDVPRPVPIRVPIPFPSMNMESLPMMGMEHQFPINSMKRDCLFQNCGQSSDTTKAATKKRMGKKYRDIADKNKSAKNTVIPQSEYIMYNSLKSKNHTN